MARKIKSKVTNIEELIKKETIIQSNMGDELRDAMLNYAIEVITDRALPNIYDGLKPVQRRILYAGLIKKYFSNGKFIKCAKYVGDVIGELNPHGDSSAYLALTALAQPWTQRYPLIDFHGNVGNYDGDEAAHMRYCVAADTLVSTDKGLIKISELAKSELNSENNIDINIQSTEKQNHASKLFNSGEHPTIKIITSHGYELIGTKNHPVLVISIDSNKKPIFAWKLLEDINENDYIVINRSLNQISSSINKINIDNLNLFTTNTNIDDIPNYILQSSKEIQSAYLQQLFTKYADIKYTLNNELEIFYKSTSFNLLKQIQILLLQFDIVTNLYSSKQLNYINYYQHDGNDENAVKQIYILKIHGKRSIVNFHHYINFDNPKLSLELKKGINLVNKARDLDDYVPFIYDYIKSHNNNELVNQYDLGKYYKFKNLKTKLIEVLSEEDYNLLNYLHTNFLFDRIVCKQNNKVQVVYSIRVDSDCHSFTANGIINHNTEAKLNKLAEADLEGTLANAVDMVPNYSETLEEPVVLPGQFPALLCNGTYGIAVGYTSNIPSHQLGEVLDGIIAYIRNNDITIDKLMQIIPGPDFSTGASLINNEEIKKLYETGKGSLKFRAKYHIETEDDLTSIIIDELPPKVNKPQLVEKLRDICLINKKIPRVLSVNDLSTTNTKIVIELAKTAIPDLVIKSIFDLTDLSKSVSYIMRAIHNNRPIIFTLKQALEFYVEHRRNCLLRENQTKLDKANKKRHAMQGLIALTNNIKKAISIIENAEDDTFAKEQLKTFFQLDDEQVEAILEVKLRRLTKLNRDDILNNIQNLDNDITLYNARKDDQSLIDELIIQQCNLLKEKFNDTRRTEIINFEETEEIQEEAHDVILILTNKNTIKVLTPDDYAEVLRQGILKEKNEIYLKYISARSNDMFIIILEDGNYIKTAFNDLIAWNSKIKIINVYPVNDVTEEQDILLMTTLGLVQKIKVSGFKARQNKPTNLFKNWIENDKLIFSMLTDTNNKNVISLITKKGLLHRFYESSLKETVSTGKNGVNAINLSDDIIADVCISSEDSSYIIIYTKHDNGYGRKIVTADSFTVKARNGKGIASITFAKKNPGYVYGFTIVNDAYIDIDNKGKLQLVDIKNLELGSRTSKPDMIDYDPLRINFMS